MEERSRRLGSRQAAAAAAEEEEEALAAACSRWQGCFGQSTD
jgi:hypothetical protein